MIYIPSAVEKVKDLHAKIVDATDAETTVCLQLELLARNLHAEFTNGNEATFVEISNWHPKFVGKDPATFIGAEFDLTDAQLTVAKGHGFRNWENVIAEGGVTFNLTFEHAVDTLLSGKLELLRKQIEDDNSLLTERSRYGHGATLLNYVASNGVEIRRQQVPPNLPEITCMLIEMGADRYAKARLYGGQFTTLELALTSAHPVDAGIMDELKKALER